MPTLAPLRALATLALCAAPLAAQSSYVFQVNQSASNCTWTGTSSLGPILGNPSNAFQLAGTTQLDLTFTATATATDGAFSGGDTSTVPDLHGRIPNIIPVLPPLATIDVVGLHFTTTSPAFTFGPGGAFSATATITATAGTLTVTPLGGSPTVTPLAGSSSAPSTLAGTVALTGSSLHLVAPLNSTFSFSDPSSGASGTITLTGTFDASYALGSLYCFGDGSGTACPCGNSSSPASQSGCLSSIGSGGRLRTSGLPFVSADSLSLDGSTMPATAVALFFQGNAADNGGLGSLRGDGLICTGGTLIRLGTRTNAAGASSFPGPGGSPSGSVLGAIPAAGGTYYYQSWYRNAASFCTPETYNLTNGVAVTWLP